LEFVLRGTGWRMECTCPRMNYHQLPTFARLVSGDPPLLSYITIQFTN
jgi:hypothetical protein